MVGLRKEGGGGGGHHHHHHHPSSSSSSFIVIVIVRSFVRSFPPPQLNKTEAMQLAMYIASYITNIYPFIYLFYLHFSLVRLGSSASIYLPLPRLNILPNYMHTYVCMYVCTYIHSYICLPTHTHTYRLRDRIRFTSRCEGGWLVD